MTSEIYDQFYLPYFYWLWGKPLNFFSWIHLHVLVLFSIQCCTKLMKIRSYQICILQCALFLYRSFINRLESRWTSTVILGHSNVCHKSGRQGRMSTVPWVLYTGLFSARVIFTFLHLQSILPSLKFTQTQYKK